MRVSYTFFVFYVLLLFERIKWYFKTIKMYGLLLIVPYFLRFQNINSIVSTIYSNLAGIRVFFDIKSINANLDWATATFNDIYGAMPNASIACLSFETDAQVITEHRFNNGGAIIFYKGTPWRGIGLLSIYHNEALISANVIGANTLTLHRVSYIS